MYLIILNPTAGRGRTLDYEAAVQHELETRQIAYKTAHTEYAGHAEVLARNAASEGISGIVCVGGDGTLFEIVNGLKGARVPLLIVPCGTGNDFIKLIAPRKKPLEALKQQLNGRMGAIDMGRANDYVFSNVAGAGFDVEVLRQTRRMKGVGRGVFSYLIAVCAAIKNFKPLNAKVTIDGQTADRALTLITIANGRYFGGGMKVAPEADPADGLFDVVMIRAISRWRIVCLLPLFIFGLHTKLKITTVVRCKSIAIEADQLTIDLDGELREADRVSFQLVPGALHLAR